MTRPAAQMNEGIDKFIDTRDMDHVTQSRAGVTRGYVHAPVRMQQVGSTMVHPVPLCPHQTVAEGCQPPRPLVTVHTGGSARLYWTSLLPGKYRYGSIALPTSPLLPGPPPGARGGRTSFSCKLLQPPARYSILLQAAAHTVQFAYATLSLAWSPLS